jgi:hypothetical protein
MIRRVKIFSLALLFFFLSHNVFCESPALQLLKQRFSRAGLSEKPQVLIDASGNRELYLHALQFALNNSELFKNDPDLISLVYIAATGLQHIGCGEVQDSECLDVLWALFLEHQNTALGAELLITVGKLGKGSQLVVDSVNNFLTEQNMLFSTGASVHYATISAGIAAILELADSSSYPVLFDILSLGYPEVIAFEALGAFELIPGDFKQFLHYTIEYSEPAEKFIAFRAGVNSERLSVAERGQLAELALEKSLVASADNADLTALRYAAVLALTPLRWTRANSLAIRHYYRMQADFQHGIVPKQRLLEAIALLGAVGNSDAALALGLQLGLINVRAERTGEFDAEATYAIVKALGLIGDNAAFDHLLTVTELPYPEYIQAAAWEAINRLRW